MGAAQASDVLEPINIRRTSWRTIVPALPRLRLAGLLTREFSVAEASFIRMRMVAHTRRGVVCDLELAAALHQRASAPVEG